MHRKSLILGTAATLAVICGASLAASAAPVDTIIAPNVAASDHKCTFAEPAEIAALGIDQTVLSPQLASNESGLIYPDGHGAKSAQRTIVKKTMLAEGDGGYKHPALPWSKPYIPAPALGGTTVI